MDEPTILSLDNVEQAKEIFKQAIDLGVEFKLQSPVRQRLISNLYPTSFFEPVPEKGKPIEGVLDEFKTDYMPYSYNFSSPQFMGFPDAGNAIASITGSLIADFMQQNLINQSFCSPSGTFAEINVIEWLRETVGYKRPAGIDSVFDVGGIITGGGTVSNTIGMLLAREHHKSGTMQNGVSDDDDFYIVVPKGIGHYSVKSAQMWLGCGNQLIEVNTQDFRYDLNDLRKKLVEHKGRVMAVVAYAGDSRTMTVDNMKSVAETVRKVDPKIWLHADACHGFSLGFSDELRHKIDGIEEFDSITADPHKVMNTPYTISALLVKDPASLKTVASLSDLIMQEDFAFGQITPFIGSKPWNSLKLWFAFKHIGRQGFGKIIEERHKRAQDFARLIEASQDFILLNEVDINSVAFMYKGASTSLTVDTINKLNQAIHQKILDEGKFHVHQFSLPDNGIIEKGALLYPLRYMSGNPLTTKQHLQDLLTYIKRLGRQLEKEQ